MRLLRDFQTQCILLKTLSCFFIPSFFGGTQQVCQVGQVCHQVKISSGLPTVESSGEGHGQAIKSHTIDVFGRGNYATIPTRSAQNAAPYSSTLLRLQGHLGLDHSLPHLLHSHHGPLQRSTEKQDLRRRLPPCRGLHRGRGIFHRHCTQLSHDLRWPWWGGGLRSKSDQTQLLEVLVRD